ncbi:zinc finger, CCHC-type containing protein [Tanacetum coccineum]
MHLAWPLWSDLRVIPTHGEFSSLSETIRYSGVSLRNKNILDLTSLIGTDNFGWSYQPIPAAPVAVVPDQPISPAALTTYNEWVKNQKEIVLKALYSKQAEQELLQTVREFHRCKQEEGQSVSSYFLKMKSYIDQLEHLGHPVTLNLGVSLILVGLSKEYDSFVQNYNMHNMGKTVNELHAMLKLHEETLPKKVATPALHAIRVGKVHKNKNKKPSKAAKGVQGKGKGKKAYANAEPSYAPKPKNPPPPKKDNPAKDAICHHCCEVGHWRRNCPTYLTELLKKKQLSQGASTSDTNDSSMYAFDSNKRAKLKLDSSLLWHCRLGHISKKRIKKLQHDGLLNSSKIESLGKCVSCKLGKMARKPYSHQVERAKDLLGI